MVRALKKWLKQLVCPHKYTYYCIGQYGQWFECVRCEKVIRVDPWEE